MFLFGDPNKKVLKKIQLLVDKINSLENDLANLSDLDLQNKGKELKTRAQSTIGHQVTNSFGHQVTNSLDNLLPEAFALVRETAKRTLGQRHYDVQLLGGIILHNGWIAEMRTGEGKTLTSTAPVFLNALSGKGVHIVTVNDYLSRRDAVWMGQVYTFLGLTVGCINNMQSFIYDADWKAETEEEKTEEDKIRDQLGSFRVNADFLRPCSRKEAYECDITFGTNNEFGFDYLRDNMATRITDRVGRGFNFAIVDEVDSILIDEARTPLIISAPAEESGDLYRKFSKIVTKLHENEDYNLDLKMRSASLTDEGINKVEKELGIENIYAEGGIKMVHHLEQALKAETLFKRDKDYVVQNGEIMIVDEFTGRLMHGRRYSEGLHQAIEAKEGVEVKRENQTLASVTFQNFFRMYDKLSGMTGTALTEAEEFAKIYNLEVVVVPTNKEIMRKDESDRIFKNKKGKYKAIVEEVRELQEKGQPVLVGTVSVEQNEELSRRLESAGVKHSVLNAKNHEGEAEIVAQAGKKGSVTVATNMAGRGVDIVLGGAPYNKELAKEVIDLGGLAVLGTERHESRRIDNQLRGRAGRQGDPGFSRFYVSLEDDLMKIFASDKVQGIMERFGLPEDMPIENGIVSRAIESAQKKVEGHNFDIRKHLLEYDDVINRHRETTYARRHHIMEEESIKEEVLEGIEEEIEQVVVFHASDPVIKKWNIKEIWEVCNTIFPLEKEAMAELEKMLTEDVDKFGAIKVRDRMAEYLNEKMKLQYEKMEARLTEQSANPKMLREIEASLSLRVIDTLWMGHLEEMDYLRAGIGLQGYAGKDPLVEYKKEAYGLWNNLQNLINRQISYSIFKVELAQKVAPSMMERKGIQVSSPAKTSDQKEGLSVVQAPGKSQDKVGRNDLCPCGSGKKYKHCHGN